MPILPLVGRKSAKIRTVILLLYAVLCLGSITMVYPFALMLSGSVSSFYDYDEYRLLPRFLFDDSTLFAKFVYEKAEIGRVGYDYGRMDEDVSEAESWIEKSDLHAPEPLSDWLAGNPGSIPLDKARRIRDDYNEFRRTVPNIWRYANWHEQFNRFDTYVMFQEWLSKNYTLEQINSEWGLALDGFDIIYPPGEDPQRHQYWPLDDHLTHAWDRFKKEVMPADYVDVNSLNYVWYYYIKRMPVAPDGAEEIGDSTAYNQVFGTQFDKFSSITFPRTKPELSEYAGFLWEQFMRDWIPATMVKLRAEPAVYQNYLRDKYVSIADYNEAHQENPIQQWTDALPSEAPPEDGRLRRDWQDFMSAKKILNASGETNGAIVSSTREEFYCPIEWIVPNAPEDAYAAFLNERYGGIQGVNEAYGWNLSRWDEIRFPNALADMVYFHENRNNLRWAFVTRNYTDVMSFIALHGRALWNTLILVVLVMFSQLTVNPMAAYALSRFRLRWTSQILLFLLATMAFPAEVAMIPSFLMIKEFGLLNTYWALVLPGVANGFGIFLLKGFFDSLPPELYEAGIMDGASEMRMFLNVTLPLSKPILAVLALGAFGAAYGEFMFAFLVCQEREMWTLMVFLYEFQQTSSVPLILTSLVLSSIPTLLVFIFCQNIILRGIVVPSFK